MVMTLVFDNPSPVFCIFRSALTFMVTPRTEVTKIAKSVTNGSFENTTRKWTFIEKENNLHTTNLSEAKIALFIRLALEGIVVVDLPKKPVSYHLAGLAF